MRGAAYKPSIAPPTASMMDCPGPLHAVHPLDKLEVSWLLCAINQ